MTKLDFPDANSYRKRWPSGLDKNIVIAIRDILSQDYHDISVKPELIWLSQSDSSAFVGIDDLLTSEGIQLVHAFWDFLLGMQPYNYVCWLFNHSNKDYLLQAPDIAKFIEQYSQTDNAAIFEKRIYFYLNVQERIKDRCWGYCNELVGKPISDWKQYLGRFNLELFAQGYGGWTPSIMTAYFNISKQDPQWVLNQLLPLTQKGKEFQVRECAYAAITQAGLLTQDLAENLRKESSMSVAAAASRALLNNINLYPDLDDLIKELLKCRHREVAIVLAQNLPDDKLPFLMGSPHPEVKSIVQERMLK